MWKYLNDSLQEFKKPCFSRTKTFNWFVIVVIGLMLVSDTLGLTSIVRELSLAPTHYTSLVHFFRSEAWHLDSLRRQWVKIVLNAAGILQSCGMYILDGDGIKVSKEGKKMPGVKKHHQESENSGKAEFIFGHLFGVIGILAGNSTKLFSIPLRASIQDGDKIIRAFADEVYEAVSHVVRVIRDAAEIASQIGPSLVLLDSYFLSDPALDEWERHKDEAGNPILHILTRAKISYTARLDLEAYGGRGRPRKIGKSIKLRDLFETHKQYFEKARVFLYGKMEEVLFYSIDLDWGEKSRKLRFVLVSRKNNAHTILATTSMALSPLKIIELYSYRFKIEVSFAALKHVVHGFMYHFWSKAMPKLDKYSKAKNEENLRTISDPKEKQLILAAFRAIEGFVCFAAISLGLLQILSLNYSEQIEQLPTRYLRTRTNKTASEATIAYTIRKMIFWVLAKFPDLAISRIIIDKQNRYLLDFSASA